MREKDEASIVVFLTRLAPFIRLTYGGFVAERLLWSELNSESALPSVLERFHFYWERRRPPPMAFCKRVAVGGVPVPPDVQQIGDRPPGPVSSERAGVAARGIGCRCIIAPDHGRDSITRGGGRAVASAVATTPDLLPVVGKVHPCAVAFGAPDLSRQLQRLRNDEVVVEQDCVVLLAESAHPEGAAALLEGFFDIVDPVVEGVGAAGKRRL